MWRFPQMDAVYEVTSYAQILFGQILTRFVWLLNLRALLACPLRVSSLENRKPKRCAKTVNELGKFSGIFARSKMKEAPLSTNERQFLLG